MTFKTMLAKLIVPESNETKEIDVAQTWEVRWYGLQLSWDFPRYTFAKEVPHMEVFTDETQAQEFAQSLRQAFQLVRVSHAGGAVSVAKRPLIR